MVARSERLSQAQRCFDLQQFAEAAKLYQAILRDDPGHILSLHRLGVVALHIQMPDRAIRLLRQALKLGGESDELLNDLGKVYVATGELDNAQRCFRRCIDRYPDSSLGYISQAYIENSLGKFDEAQQTYQVALERVSNSFELQFNVATFARERGQLDDAVTRYDQLLAQFPEVALLQDGRARALLQQRKWQRGWDDYEARFRVEDEAAKINLQLPIARWEGQPLAGRRLLVLYEQGIGDEVQFASCYRDVIEQAAHCTLTCSPRLTSILSRSFPNATFVGVDSSERETWAPADPTQFDYFIAAGSLPRYCRQSDQAFPRIAYLATDDRKSSDGSESKSIPRIGVSWWGGAVPEQIRKRSVPLESFERLFAVTGVQFVNLQHGCKSELTPFTNVESHPEIDPYHQLDAWFDLISSLDLLVSVDNSNVHFAGSLGVRTWLLLSDHPNWRWPHDCTTSNWYQSVNFIRKERRSWGTVIDDVASRLRNELHM